MRPAAEGQRERGEWQAPQTTLPFQPSCCAVHVCRRLTIPIHRADMRKNAKKSAFGPMESGGLGKKKKNQKKEVDEKNRGAYGSQHLIGLRRESGG
jgi:hypothetical protein